LAIYWEYSVFASFRVVIADNIFSRRVRKMLMNRKRFIIGLNNPPKISENERKHIIRKSIERQHWKTKCTIAMEEFAELQQQISKQIRGYEDRVGLLEEMADAYICLEFLKSIFDITESDVKRAIDVKLLRERNNQK
jgi:hypothetical protein